MRRWLVMLAILAWPSSALAQVALTVDSDDPAIDRSSLAPDVARELRDEGPVAIAVRYRREAHELVVSATMPDGKRVERSVTATGDAAAIRKVAVLLAGNVARDEARELIEALSARPKKDEDGEVETEDVRVPQEAAPVHPPELAVATLSLFFPLATNHRYPDIDSAFNLDVLYGRVGTSRAFQLSALGIARASQGVHGAQLALLGAIDGGDLHGVQIAGGVNVAARLHGMQVATFANVDDGGRGLQVGGVNVTSELSGMQVGLVNIGRRVKGLQVGVVNIAEEADGALGVVSISRDSVFPVFWSGNLTYLNVGVRFSSKYLYTLVAVSDGTLETPSLGKPFFTAGLGTHFGLWRQLDADIDVLWSQTTGDATNMALEPRFLPGWSFARHLRVFAGPGVRFPLQFEVGHSVVRPEFLGGIQL